MKLRFFGLLADKLIILPLVWRNRENLQSLLFRAFGAACVGVRGLLAAGKMILQRRGMSVPNELTRTIARIAVVFAALYTTQQTGKIIKSRFLLSILYWHRSHGELARCMKLISKSVTLKSITDVPSSHRLFYRAGLISGFVWQMPYPNNPLIGPAAFNRLSVLLIMFVWITKIMRCCRASSSEYFLHRY